jgi:hypothetical protein
MVLSCFRCRDNQGRDAQHQNTKFGKGRRAHRQIGAWLLGKPIWRCTVCGNERTEV